jgi:hypothetical protein
MLMRKAVMSMFGLVLASVALPAVAQTSASGSAASECSTQQGCAAQTVRKSGGANGLSLRGSGSGVSALSASGPASVGAAGGKNGLSVRGNGSGVSALQSSGKPVWTGGGANGLSLRGNGTGRTGADAAE